MAQSDLLVRIGADLRQLQTGLDKGLKSLSQFGYKAEQIGSSLSTRISAPIIAIGAAAVSTFAKFDKLEKGLSAITGSTEEGARQLDTYLDVVKDVRTTLDLQTAVGAALKLQAVGVSAGAAERTIRQLGIAATVSGSNIDDVGGVVRQFTQIIGKGKIEQEDLNSILDRMPALAAVIKKEFGASTAEQIRATGISMEQFVGRTVEALEANENFQNVQGGISKALESFGIELQIAGKELGETIAKTIDLEGLLGKISSAIGRATKAFSELNPTTQKVIVYTAGAAAAMGPLALGIGAVAKSIPLLISGLKLAGAPLVSFASGIATIATRISGYANLLLRGGAIGRSLAFAQAASKIRLALVAITGPVGLIVAGIAALVTGFTKAYRGSEFFRAQIDRLSGVFSTLVETVKNFVGSSITSLFSGISSLSGAFKTFQAILAGTVSAIVEFILIVKDNVVGVFSGIGDLLSGNFKEGFAKLEGTILGSPIDGVVDGAKRLGNAFATTFQETLDFKVAAPEIASATLPTLVNNDFGGGGGSGGNGPAARTETAVNPIAPGALDSAALLGLKLLELGTNAKALNDTFDKLKVNTEGNVSVFDSLREGLEIIDAKAVTFGASYDAIGEKINLVKGLMTQSIEEGYDPTSHRIELLNEQLLAFQTANDAVTASLERQKEAFAAIGAASSGAFDLVTSSMDQGANVVKAFGNAVLESVKKAISAQIKLAVVSQIQKALATVPFPFNVGIAAAAGAGVSALVNSVLGRVKIPALAKGGFVDSPTLALIGEAGPEVVVPLDRLQEFQNGGSKNVNITGQFRISGRDLVALIDRERASLNRIR